MLCSLKLFLEWKVAKDLLESLMLEISQKLSDWFALSIEQSNATRPLIRGGIVDVPVWKCY